MVDTCGGHRATVKLKELLRPEQKQRVTSLLWIEWDPIAVSNKPDVESLVGMVVLGRVFITGDPQTKEKFIFPNTFFPPPTL